MALAGIFVKIGALHNKVEEHERKFPMLATREVVASMDQRITDIHLDVREIRDMLRKNGGAH